MIKKFLVIVFIISHYLVGQDSVQVTFIVEAENMPENTTVFITGNVSVLGRWIPDYQPMEFVDNKWQKILQFQQGTSLEFKFTKGNWQSEALNDDKRIPSNYIVKVISDTVLFYKINYWSDQFLIPDETNISGQITGTVKYHKNFKSKNVLPRDISVWLPPGYEIEKDIRYPVLYMHDGQNAFDPVTSAFGVDWQIDEAADSLIRKNFIKPIIIVAINNSIHRRSEYANNDTGYAYVDFIIEEVKPFIDSAYRTLIDGKNTAVVGSSLGGLISFIMAWENPEIFSMAACLSSALKIDRYDFISEVKNYSGEKKPIKIYLDNGGIGIETELQSGNDEMILLLNKSGFEQMKDLYWFKDLNAEHSEKDWAERVWRPLIFFFGNDSSKKFLEN